MRTPLFPVSLAALALVGLGSCAKVGTLERPAPLYGAKAKAEYKAEQHAAEKAKAAKRETGGPEPAPDPNDPATWRSTPHSRPLPGQGPSPFAPAPPGVLPDPFNQPGP